MPPPTAGNPIARDAPAAPRLRRAPGAGYAGQVCIPGTLDGGARPALSAGRSVVGS